MPIKLTIEITSPLTPEDHDMLTGVSIMTLAIANHEVAQQAFPGTFPSDDDEVQSEKPEHQHSWVPGVIAIEDCEGCGDRRLAEALDVRAN